MTKLSMPALLIGVVAIALPALVVAQVPTSGIPTVQTTTTITTTQKTPNWNDENTYWKENYTQRPYYDSAKPYAAYEPAYRYGFELHQKNQGKAYSDLDKAELNNGWGAAKGSSTLNWRDAEAATKDAYNHVYNDNNTHNSGKTPEVNKNIPEVFPPAAR